ncbi:MAG: NAD(P)H-hydrate dehydratase [Proteobacteria bacterium]|nr:NAD(P)H-hydrate dehydratase [Pseudomonadota bacterium]
MFHPLPTPEEMAAWDRQAIKDFGIRGEILMENAARAAVDALGRRFGSLAGASVLVLAGPGNNGGDGFAMARRLFDAGASVTVLHTRPKKSYRGEARYHLDLARRAGVAMHLLSRFDFSCLTQPDIIIDALLGTGFSGQLREESLNLIRLINELGRSAFVLAVDIPSGLDGQTGLPCPEAVRANLTTTFHAAKLGLAIPCAAAYTGMVEICEIGIPILITARSKPTHFLITHDVLGLVPRPEAEMHKGTAGHVLVVGGSRGLTGAPHLAALGALRAGAGLVTIACPSGLETLIKAGSPDIMTLPLGDSELWHPAMAGEINLHLPRFDAVVIGPGLGRSPEAAEFLTAFLVKLTLPCVIDADALYHLALIPALTPKHAVLTPHPGEMGRFTGVGPGTVQSDRFRAARNLAETTGSVALLKGSGTVVAEPGGTAYLSSLSAPNLAVGGSGDVLSGLIAALLARSISPLPAACLGVYWHGVAGKMLETNFPGRGNLASQIADALPLALKEYQCAQQTTS